MSSRAATETLEDHTQLRPIAAFAYSLYKRGLSPILHAVSPSACRYVPSCSEYAYISFLRFGAVRGAWLTLRRLLRCHPWGKGGLDPVPECASPARQDTIS